MQFKLYYPWGNKTIWEPILESTSKAINYSCDMDGLEIDLEIDSQAVLKQIPYLRGKRL